MEVSIWKIVLRILRRYQDLEGAIVYATFRMIRTIYGLMGDTTCNLSRKLMNVSGI